jgi:hypothetical protein
MTAPLGPCELVDDEDDAEHDHARGNEGDHENERGISFTKGCEDLGHAIHFAMPVPAWPERIVQMTAGSEGESLIFRGRRTPKRAFSEGSNSPEIQGRAVFGCIKAITYCLFFLIITAKDALHVQNLEFI